MRNQSVVALAFVAVFGLACGTDETAGEPDVPLDRVEVVAANFAFDPTSISADPGDVINVILVNEDDVEHSFTIDDVVDVEAHGGEDASGSFTAPDSTVEFYCRYHPDQMRGEVTIGGSSGADTGGGGMMDDQDIDY